MDGIYLGMGIGALVVFFSVVWYIHSEQKNNDRRYLKERKEERDKEIDEAVRQIQWPWSYVDKKDGFHGFLRTVIRDEVHRLIGTDLQILNNRVAELEKKRGKKNGSKN
jgi:hypothetical protein